MDLSAREFAEIVSSFSEAGATLDHEKRRASRVIHTGRVPLIFDHDTYEERREIATVVDLSSRGVGLLHREKLRRGQQFVLQLNRPRGEPAMMLCSVVHCRQHGKGIFKIGAEFVLLLNAQILQDPVKSAEDIVRIRNSMFS
jgi:hypothetical protein